MQESWCAVTDEASGAVAAAEAGWAMLMRITMLSIGLLCIGVHIGLLVSPQCVDYARVL